MISYQAVTEEIDDLDEAVAELKEQLAGKKMLKNTVGIVYAAFATDSKALAEKLSENFDFPFMGCTGIGLLTTGGYVEEAISMTVLTADDCEFSLAMSGPVSLVDSGKELQEAYDKAAGKLQEKEKVMLAYLPWDFGAVYDLAVSLLNRISGGIPIFGGICADGWTFDNAYVFGEGGAWEKKAAILLISGNVHPVTVRVQSIDDVVGSERTVTRADGLNVYEVDHDKIGTYLNSMGIQTDEKQVMASFMATPFVDMRKTEDGDRVRILRSLNSISMTDDSCGFVGMLKEGDVISLSYMSKKTIESSVSQAFDELAKILEKNGSSTVLVSSCAGRYSMLVGDKNAEGRGYLGKLPEGVELAGGYIFGEFCPAKGEKSGKFYNVFNNETFAILAF